MPDVPVIYQNQSILSTIGTTINIDFSSKLTQDYEDVAPLLTLLGKLPDATTATNTFKFAINRIIPRSTTLASGSSVGASAGAEVTIAVTTDDYFNQLDKVEVLGGTENATHTSQGYITTSPTGNDLLVKPYDVTKIFAAQSSGAIIRVISSRIAEGSTIRPAIQTVPTVYTQYCSTFEDAFQLSIEQAQNRQYTDPERTRLREEKRKRHVLDQENDGFFSRLSLDKSTATAPVYQMAGLEELITTNVITYNDDGKGLSKEKLFNAMTKLHRPMYSAGNKRTVLGSADFISDTCKLADPAVRITPDTKKLGISITTLDFAGRSWDLIESPVLSEARPGEAYVLHLPNVRKRTFLPTVYKMNVQANDANYFKDAFRSTWGLELLLEEAMGRFKP